jgi:hypothetical protein
MFRVVRRTVLHWRTSPKQFDQTIEYESDEDFAYDTSIVACSGAGPPSRFVIPGSGLENQRQIRADNGNSRGLLFHLQQQPHHVHGGSDETVCSVVSNETHVTTELQRF